MSGRKPEIDENLRVLLARRAAWRWSLTTLLIVSYFGYALGSLYFPQAYATTLPGMSIPIGILAGLFIIILSVVTSLLYVRAIGRLTTKQAKLIDDR